MDTAQVDDINRSIRVYIFVSVALAILTLITVGLSYFIGPQVPVILIIAGVQGFLAAGYFMHLIPANRMITLVLIITAVFLTLLIIVPYGDFFHSRGTRFVP